MLSLLFSFACMHSCPSGVPFLRRQAFCNRGKSLFCTRKGYCSRSNSSPKGMLQNVASHPLTHNPREKAIFSLFFSSPLLQLSPSRLVAHARPSSLPSARRRRLGTGTPPPPFLTGSPPAEAPKKKAGGGDARSDACGSTPRLRCESAATGLNLAARG
jgi:hypothetical protein